MIPLVYIFAVVMGLVGIAFAGLASDRHFLVIMLAIELILVASTILLVGFFTYSSNPDPGAFMMLISIWTVAAVEIITLITFYLYMKQRNVDFDVTKLSKMKW
jgi:NADH:ubiquinone oxidoreductase subunit K